MSTNLEVLEAEALKLAPADRSHLLERLIASLDSDPEVEAAWEQEADRREALLEAGSMAEVSGAEALSRLRLYWFQLVSQNRPACQLGF